MLCDRGDETEMNSISEKDLKTKVFSAIEHALEDQPHVSLTVRVQTKYVVMNRERRYTPARVRTGGRANLNLGRTWTQAVLSKNRSNHTSITLPNGLSDVI